MTRGVGGEEQEMRRTRRGGREGRGGKEEAFFNGIMGGFSIYLTTGNSCDI